MYSYRGFSREAQVSSLKWLFSSFSRTSLCIISTLACSLSAFGQTETTLYNFTGDIPNGGLVADAAGNLYGTAWNSNANSFGQVFELSPDSSGIWTEKILYNFQGSPVGDGSHPSAGLIFDSKGNLYGTTQYGGVGGFCYGGLGCGTVFILRPQSDGTWKERVLHRFHNEFGGEPVASLAIDSAGNLYGTTQSISEGTAGEVFELSPVPNGLWTETIIYPFPNNQTNHGTEPFAPVILDSAGNLYGTASAGGQYRAGAAFKLSPGAGGWTYTALHIFGAKGDGAAPWGGLAFDSAGNLYGTTFGGGSEGYGTVFELSSKSSGRWVETILHSFSSTDGKTPTSSLVFDSVGNLYGAAGAGGANGEGTIFELSPISGGWNFDVLYSFSGSDGGNPAGPLLYLGGSLYGVASTVAFELTP